MKLRQENVYDSHIKSANGTIILQTKNKLRFNKRPTPGNKQSVYRSTATSVSHTIFANGKISFTPYNDSTSSNITSWLYNPNNDWDKVNTRISISNNYDMNGLTNVIWKYANNLSVSYEVLTGTTANIGLTNTVIIFANLFSVTDTLGSTENGSNIQFFYSNTTQVMNTISTPITSVFLVDPTSGP